MIRAKISIIVPIKNSERYLKQALDSIVNQNYNDYEIIVVHDGFSADKSLDIALSYKKVICIRVGKQGHAPAMNAGIAKSRAEFIAFLDSDDTWSQNKLALQMSLFKVKPEIECTFGNINYFLESGCQFPKGYNPKLLTKSHAVPATGNMLIRRNILNRIGPLNERMKIAGDISWIAKIRDSTKYIFINQVVLNKRLHQSNLGNSCWSTFKSELLITMKNRINTKAQSLKSSKIF